MAQTTQRVSNKRWLEAGWDSQRAATDFYRRVWTGALASGVKPGEPIRHFVANVQWLVEGHPYYAQMSANGIKHFTIRPDGRGNHRFVLTDRLGFEHPFSTNVALTGFEEPLREPAVEDKPFEGMTS